MNTILKFYSTGKTIDEIVDGLYKRVFETHKRVGTVLPEPYDGVIVIKPGDTKEIILKKIEAGETGSQDEEDFKLSILESTVDE